MQSIIRFLKNVWNAQRNARNCETLNLICHDLGAEIDRLTAENAALRQQASKRDSSGRFAPKNTGQ